MFALSLLARNQTPSVKLVGHLQDTSLCSAHELVLPPVSFEELSYLQVLPSSHVQIT